MALGFRTVISGRYGQLRSGWDFFTSGVHRFFATKPARSETDKQHTVVRGQPWFYWGLVAHSFFGLSEGD